MLVWIILEYFSKCLYFWSLYFCRTTFSKCLYFCKSVCTADTFSLSSSRDFWSVPLHSLSILRSVSKAVLKNNKILADLFHKQFPKIILPVLVLKNKWRILTGSGIIPHTLTPTLWENLFWSMHDVNVIFRTYRWFGVYR